VNQETRNFDTRAAAWDEQPQRVKLARDVAEAISRQVTLTPQTKVLDFGCGTGLVSMQLQPRVHSILGVDTSAGMLEVFQSKIAALKLASVRTALIDPSKDELPRNGYDLVVSSMALHHVPEVPPLLARFYRMIAPDGHLCIADLDLEGGRFHDDNTGVFHSGFDRQALRRQFADAGFGQISDVTAAEIEKPGRDDKPERFSVFLMTGRKPVKPV
jgi:ubiquinone/menaquinone biosynthesis C-methylase UbiE